MTVIWSVLNLVSPRVHVLDICCCTQEMFDVGSAAPAMCNLVIWSL